MKIRLLLLILIFPYFLLMGEKIGDLPQINIPFDMVTDGEKLFVVEKEVIYIYNLSPFK